MKQTKPVIHFTDKYLLSPTNPVSVNLIGAGGTGSQVLTALARMNESLIALGHPGLFVRLFDNDIVTRANLGRQLFAANELGQYKSAALISRVNRFFGTNWKSVCARYDTKSCDASMFLSNITISCVDTVAARFAIALILKKTPSDNYRRDRNIYWMDFGNAKDSGQVILSTVHSVTQPPSEKFITTGKLPWITNEFKEILKDTNEDTLPSCSLAEALTRQDLFINSSISALGASLLWNLFREGMIQHRGLFLNLKDFRMQPITITPDAQKSRAKQSRNVTV